MATPITTTATSLEGQLLEVAQAMAAAELAMAENIRPDRVQLDPTLEQKTITVTVNLDVSMSAGATGQLVLSVVPYLV